MVFLLDGGFSSQLEKHVGEIECNPLWSSKYLHTNPQAIVNAHYDYIKAGADIVLTNTYQAFVGGFQKHLNLDENASVKLLSTSVDLVRKAIDKANPGREVLIAGSIGPYGASLCDGSEYNGKYIDEISEADLIAWHKPRIEILIDKKVDLLAIETIPALAEALAILKILKEFPLQKAWISFSTMDTEHISHGEKFSEAASECWKQSSDQLVAVGMNCQSPEFVTPLLKTVKHLNIPWIVKPNRGEKWVPGIGWTNKETCVPLTNFAPEWLSLGVRYIGSCCQSTDEDIKQLRRFIDSQTQIKDQYDQ